MNITQQRTRLSKLTELALMMQIAESFKTVSPKYYNDRMTVLEQEYRQAVMELAESVLPAMNGNDIALHMATAINIASGLSGNGCEHTQGATRCRKCGNLVFE